MAMSAAPRLALRGALTISTCESTLQTVREALGGGEAVVLDCSEATEVDLSLLQILFAAQQEAARSGKRIGLSAPPSHALAEALRRCGFTPAAHATSLAEIFAS